MIQGLFDGGAMPALERLVQFTGQRHKVLLNNIANLSTPYYKPSDLDPNAFQASLRDAIDRRRASTDANGPLKMTDTDQLHFRDTGIDATPTATGEGIMFHDQNDRDLDRTMQHLAENTMAHNAGLVLMKSELDLMRTAIRERM